MLLTQRHPTHARLQNNRVQYSWFRLHRILLSDKNMPGASRSRRRKKEKQLPHLELKEKVEHESKSFCHAVVRVWAVISFSFLCYLFYAYATSPISSVLINDYHDVGSLKWVYPIKSNADLQNGVTLARKVKGAVSIAVDDYGNWYTGAENGRIFLIQNGGHANEKVTEITTEAEYNDKSHRLQRRPLGLRIQNNNLYVADAYQGLFVLDLSSRRWKNIVRYNDVSPPMMLIDDLTITKDGKTIYFTDVSTRWEWKEVACSLAEGECSGRIFKVNLESGAVEIVKDGLCFPNGIQLNPEESKIIVSEHGRSRLSVLDLKSQTIVKTIFLPGGSDKIRPSLDGGYWIAIPSLHNSAADFTFKMPRIRDAIVGVLGSKGLMKIADLSRGIVVKLNSDFDHVGIHYDLDGKLTRAVTEVRELQNGELLLGSFVAEGIVKIKNPYQKTA